MEKLKADRIANPEKHRKRDRKRYPKRKDKMVEYNRGWRENNRDLVLKYGNKWRDNNRQKYRAEDLVRYYIKTGKIKRDCCEICDDQNSHAHHDDYSKPLEVHWLCRTHHSEYHRKRKFDQ